MPHGEIMIKFVGLTDSDIAAMDKNVNAKKFYRLADVKDKIEKVAFDVVRFKDSDDFSNLWVVENHNGEDVIVAMYDDEPLESKSSTEKQASWQALPDRTRSSVTVFYQGNPIRKIALKDMGYESDQAQLICRTLKQKLASDVSFRNKFMRDLPNQVRNDIFDRYPELKGEK